MVSERDYSLFLVDVELLHELFLVLLVEQRYFFINEFAFQVAFPALSSLDFAAMREPDDPVIIFKKERLHFQDLPAMRLAHKEADLIALLQTVVTGVVLHQ